MSHDFEFPLSYPRVNQLTRCCDEPCVKLSTFTLPVVMTGPAAATLPLQFLGSDAGYSQLQSIGSQIGFDPKQPFVITFSQNGRGSVFLGGTAQPSPTQRAGSYTATITLTVVSLP